MEINPLASLGRTSRLPFTFCFSPFTFPLPVVLVAFFILVFLAPPNARAYEREWTSVEGRKVTAKLLRYDGEKISIEVGGQPHVIPLDRLSEKDRRHLEKQPHQDVADGPVLQHDIFGYVLPVKLPRLPVLEWNLQDGRVIRGRLVGRDYDTTSFEVSGRVHKLGIVPMFEQMDPRFSSYVYEWTRFGPLDDYNPEGQRAEQLRALGLKGYRYWIRKSGDINEYSIPFQWFAPAVDPGKKYPLVVFLHGIGERGNDNVAQLSKHREPLLFISPEFQQQQPCFFMAPQHGMKSNWFSTAFTEKSELQNMTVSAIRRMLTVEHAGQIDENRIYITGLSSGGRGAAHFIGLYPDVFAAAAPISCRPRLEWYRDRIVRPMWFFLNEHDSPIYKQTIEALITEIPRGKPAPRLTIFQGARGHNAWGRAYRSQELRDWLFEQRLE